MGRSTQLRLFGMASVESAVAGAERPKQGTSRCLIDGCRSRRSLTTSASSEIRSTSGLAARGCLRTSSGDSGSSRRTKSTDGYGMGAPRLTLLTGECAESEVGRTRPERRGDRRLPGRATTRSRSASKGASPTKAAFIDLFAGCGGLSLGLMASGWRGLFAVEQNADAFNTLRHNLIDQDGHNQGRPRFDWPAWLEVCSHEIGSFIDEHRARLRGLRKEVHLVAGGPPCQGFSFAGRRSAKDPRNKLFRFHLEIVDLLRPELVLLENVQGIDTAFGAKAARKKKRRGRPRKSYADRIKNALAEHGYFVQQPLVKAVDFGVPQLRPRIFTVGVRSDLYDEESVPVFADLLDASRRGFLHARGLPIRRPVSVADAISDLETAGKKTIPCTDAESPPGFEEAVYEGPVSAYQKLMRRGMDGQPPNSMRLVNHRPETVRRFRRILQTCRKGVQLSDNDRERLGIKKSAIAPLSPGRPSHTLTTLPDDLLHYSEPRIHTVREHARLQSFPDWFQLRGKFTTGGDRRKRECPRYSQVGNAVPPLLAEAVGAVLLSMLSASNSVR